MKQIILIPLLIILFTGLLTAQNQSAYSFSIKIKDCDDKEQQSKPEPKEIVANFIVDNAYGAAPLSVQYADRSTGGVVKWLWHFGDGAVDSVENPTHIFSQEGKYITTLSVWDAESNVSVATREIRAVGYGLCDTLNYDIPGSLHLYHLETPESGFLSGNNSRGDLAKASYFNVDQEKGMLMGGLFNFALKRSDLTTDPLIIFKAWDNDGVSSSPGTVLDTAGVLLSDIKISEIQGINPTTLALFDAWVSIDDDFFLGVDLPQTLGDTVALFTNKTTATTNGNGWEQTAAGEWRTYEDGNPGFDVDNAIYPIICQPTGIDNHILEQHMLIYPVPATDRIYISVFNQELKNVKASLVDISGRIIIENISVSTSSSIDVSHLSEGLYIIRLQTDEGVYNKKIMIK